MATIKENIEHLNALILEGKAMEGFELYYDENVVMQENDQEPCIGKDANRQRELEFFGNITEFRSATVEHVAVGDNVTMVQWKNDYTHKEWGERRYTQVAVQEWKDGKIVREQFLYGS